MLSIIIVNFWGGEILYNCIASVVKETGSVEYEIIVVNNSVDDKCTKEAVLTQYPIVKWVEMGYNAGFGRANNKAFEIAKGDVYLLLNPDCCAKDNAIGYCYQQFSVSSYAACGIKLMNDDGTFQISGNYAMKGGLNYLLPLPYIGNLLKVLGKKLRVATPHVEENNHQEITEVDWISGAFLMVKKSAIDIAGGFDEDFFLYAEEAEWCSRLRKVGKLCIFNNYSIFHSIGALSINAFDSDSNSYYALYDKKGKQIMLSNFVRIRKEFGVGWFLFIYGIYCATIPVYLFTGIVHSLITFKNQLKHWAGFSNNVISIVRFIPSIISNKKTFYKVL